LAISHRAGYILYRDEPSVALRKESLMNQVSKIPLLSFPEVLLRGAGQVFFQNNPWTGLIIIAGVAISSWVAAVDFLVGAGVATLVARWFQADEGSIQAGFFSLSGGYVGLLVGMFTHPAMKYPVFELTVFVVLGGILAVPLTAGLNHALKRLELPATMFPVVVLLWALLAGILYTDLTELLKASPLLSARPETSPPYTWKTWLFGITNGFGRVFMQLHPITGLLILLGILVNSRIAALMALLGGALSILTGSLFGLYEPILRSGVMSYNPILTAVALGGFYLYFSWRSVIYALLGTLLSIWFFVALSVILEPMGLPAAVLPMVLVVWIMLLGAQTSGFVRQVPLPQLTRPEDHLKHGAE
jgi:urea transporter